MRTLCSLLLTALFAVGATAPPAASAQDVFTQRTGSEVQADTVEARRFDDGRMWTFDAPPVDYLEDRYDIDVSDAWLERARLGAVRIPGCTASFSSGQGLLLTNHHCARSHATRASRPGENILDEGFYAESLGAERKVPSMHADQLVRITDVTEEVRQAVADAETDAERADARRSAIESIQERLVNEAGGEGYRVEVIALYDGAKYSAYTFRRYTDVRLVFIPELQLGYFGGDTDNFTYPRYALDMALFRVYDDEGNPLEPEHYFPWNPEGARPGDPVFVMGNPGSTLRLETHDQLAFRRDVQDVSLLRFLETRVDALQQFVEATPDAPKTWQNTVFSLQNGVKLYDGRVEALNDAYIMTRIEKGDAQFARALRRDTTLRREYGALIDSMAVLQQAKREYAEAYQAFRLLTNPAYTSATLRRALAVRQNDALGGGAVQKAVEAVKQAGTQPAGVDRRFLAARLTDVQTHFGAEDSVTTAALQGQSPQARAAAVLEGSVLADSASAIEALTAGTLSADDPALQLVDAFFPTYQRFSSAWSGLMARQQEVAESLGRARFALYGTEVPPDATFSLRLSDGVVRGYDYNGTVAPPFTTYHGLYEHYHAYGPESEWALPQRWLEAPGSFDRATPVNLVSTNDITGGNSGSPLLNANLEVVGLIFDGNIESLAGDYIYLPGRMRAVSVDVRGIIEALDEIYDADRLVQEATGGAFVETEAAAGESTP